MEDWLQNILGLHMIKIVQKAIDNISAKRYSNGMSRPIELPTLRCLRCNHIWVPNRPVEPKVCPKCNSPYWNKPRRQKGVKKCS